MVKAYRTHYRSVFVLLMMGLILLYTLQSGLMTAYAMRPKMNLTESKVVVTRTRKLEVEGAAGKVTWKSSNPSVATVSKKGKVTAKKVGNVTITALCEGKKYTCRIEVLPKPPYFKHKYALKLNQIPAANESRSHLVVNTPGGKRRYRAWFQKDLQVHNLTDQQLRRMAASGCTACVLASVLSAYAKEEQFRNMNPGTLRYYVLGDPTTTGLWTYDHAGDVLHLAGISYIKGDFPSDTDACRQIVMSNLLAGRPMMVLVYRDPRHAGLSGRWTGYLHSVLLTAVTETGHIVVMDSINQSWSGAYQRFKIVEPDQICDYLGRCGWTEYYTINE